MDGQGVSVVLNMQAAQSKTNQPCRQPDTHAACRAAQLPAVLGELP